MKKAILAIFLMMMISFNVSALTAHGDYSFDPPTEREAIGNEPPQALMPDEISHYKVYRNGIEVPAGTIEPYPVPGTAVTFTMPLILGPNDVHMTTIDKDGRESVPSVTVSLPWYADPKPVRNISGQIRIE